MNTLCINHVDQPAISQCAQCNNPICEKCTEQVAGQDVCKTCVARIRERIESQMAAEEPFSVPPTQPSYQPAVPSVTPIETTPVYPPQNAPYYAAQASTLPAWRFPAGVVVASLVGLLGAFIWAVVISTTHFNLGLLTIAIGYAVAYTLVGISQRGGTVPAIISAVITFLAQIIGHIMLIVTAANADQSAGGGIPLSVAISYLPREIDVMGWVIIAIGTYVGYTAVLRRRSQ